MTGKSSAIYGATSAVAVTPSDTTEIPVTRGVWVGGAGDLAVQFTGDDEAVTLGGVAAGTLLPIQVTKVMSANTTATGVLALY